MPHLITAALVCSRRAIAAFNYASLFKRGVKPGRSDCVCPRHGHGGEAAKKQTRKQLFNQATAVGSGSCSLANLPYWSFFFVFFFASPQERNCTPPLISRRAASSAQGARAVTRGRECLFISLFPTLPKGADPLKMVNGLCFRSVCARLSYLIKYLQRLIGPSRSRPAG